MANTNRPYGGGQRSQQTRQQEQATRSSGPTAAGAGNQAPVVRKPMGKQKLFEKFGEKFGVDSDLLVETLKATCFRGQKADAPPVTNEQLVALLIVADQYGLNPFTKEIYAYPDKNGGIVPVVSVDGWIRIINEHPEFNGMQITISDEKVEDKSDRKFKHKPCWEWMEVTIFRKDREHNQPVVEYFDEVYRPSLNVKDRNSDKWYEVATPWQSHTKRMMRHKSIIQAGRVTFGFGGIYDDDEAERILNDDRVVSTVENGAQPATHTDAAREALKRKQAQQPAKAAEQPTADADYREKVAQGLQEKLDTALEHRSRGTPVSDHKEPWDEPDEGVDDDGPQTSGQWIAALKAQADANGVREVMAAYVDWSDKKGLEELDIEVEAVRDILMEKFNG